MIDQEKLSRAFKLIIEAIGEDSNREGLLETPDRVARMYTEIFAGLTQDPCKCLSKIFTAERDDLVLLKDIDFHSMCEHHFMPFFGKVHIAYLPNNKKITGLSKLARLVETLSKRPQIQENFTSQIADTINECLQPKGVMVVTEAKHLCISMRGIRNISANTTTTSIRGVFETDNELKNNVLSLINNDK